MHGKGVLVYRNGSVFTGVFKAGRPVNAGTYTFANQMSLAGKWNQDHVLEGKVCVKASDGGRYRDPVLTFSFVNFMSHPVSLFLFLFSLSLSLSVLR